MNSRGRKRGGEAGRLTTADLVVLSLLSERPMHGYELIRTYTLQEVEDWAQVSRPHVYYALQKLSAAGLIAPAGPGEGEARRQVYRVTEAGADALADGLADPAWATAHAPPPFRTWLGLSIHARPADVIAMREARLRHLRSELERERRSLTMVETFDSPRAPVGEAMVRLAIALITTELAWLEALPLPATRASPKIGG